MEASAVYRVRYARALVVIPYLVPVGRRTYAVRRTIRKSLAIQSSLAVYFHTQILRVETYASYTVRSI